MSQDPADNPASIHPPNPPEPPVLFQRARPAQPLEGEQAFREWLAALAAEHTGRQVAAAAGLDPVRISALIHGRISIGRKMAARFGFERVVKVLFVPVDAGRQKKPEGPKP